MLDRLFKHASASRWVLAGAAYAGDGAGILHADVTMWSCGRRGHCAARGAASRGETYLRLGCMLVLAPAGDGLGGAGGVSRATLADGYVPARAVPRQVQRRPRVLDATSRAGYAARRGRSRRG